MTAADDRAALPQWTEDDIDRLLEVTDFALIRTAMLAVGWMWYMRSTPTVEEMRTLARRLLEDALANWRDGECDRICSSGGFYAHFGRDDAGLEFVLSTATIDETGHCDAV